MNPDIETADEKAVRLLQRQLDELQTIRTLNYKHPDFKAWRDTTDAVLERFVGPESTHYTRFFQLRFSGPGRILPYGARRPHPDYISPEDARYFKNACETAEATLKAAIGHVADFGVYAEEPKPARGKGARGARINPLVVTPVVVEPRRGGVVQNFHGPTTIQNLAIAADNAIQKIEHMGDATGASLKEITDLLQQSEDLTPREVKLGLADIEALAVEVQKPDEQRNWKSVLDSGQKVLDIAGKATDLAKKLAPYTPAIIALIEKAKHLLT